MSASPLVSVIMPAYNAGAFLRPAVESLFAQTHVNWELILIDDGSTDGSVEALADLDDPRIRRFRQKNSGKPAAMNRGLSLARGEFYALLDADDLSEPTRLERQASCLAANPEAAGFFCGHYLILEGRRLAPTFRAKSTTECARDIAAGRMPGHDPTAMYRMSMVREVRYSEDLAIGEGFDYIMRVGERFPLLVLGECLYGYRVHAQSLTKKNPSYRNRLIQEAFNRMYDRRGEARRAAPGLDRGSGGRLRDADNDMVSHFTTSVADQVLAGRRGGAVSTGLACWRLHPASAYYAKPLLYAMTPQVLMKVYRRVKEWRTEARLVRESAARRERAR